MILKTNQILTDLNITRQAFYYLVKNKNLFLKAGHGYYTIRKVKYESLKEYYKVKNQM